MSEYTITVTQNEHQISLARVGPQGSRGPAGQASISVYDTGTSYETGSTVVLSMADNAPLYRAARGVPAGNNAPPLAMDPDGELYWQGIGSAGFTERGGVEYDSNQTYSDGDLVTSGNDIYISLVNDNTAALTDVNSWHMFIAGGAGRGGQEYDATVTYSDGDLVTSGNSIFLCLQDNNTGRHC